MLKKRKPTHPGIVLKEDVLIPLGLSITEAAKDLGVARKTLSELVHEKSSLSPDMAIRIARATKTSAESWLAMQSKLDLWKSEQKKLQVIPFPERKNEDLHLAEG